MVHYGHQPIIIVAFVIVTWVSTVIERRQRRHGSVNCCTRWIVYCAFSRLHELSDILFLIFFDFFDRIQRFSDGCMSCHCHRGITGCTPRETRCVVDHPSWFQSFHTRTTISTTTTAGSVVARHTNNNADARRAS